MFVRITSCLLLLSVLVKSDEKTHQQVIDEILNDVLKELSNKNQILKILNSTLEENSRVGDHHERVYVDLLMADGSKKRKSYEIQGYDQENYNEIKHDNISWVDLQKFSNVVVPDLEELADEMGDFSEDMFVKVIGIKNQVVIREDIRRYGNYTRMNRFGLDLKHCQLALMTFAKFHAMTAVLNERGKLNFKNDKDMLEWGNLKENKPPGALARAIKTLTDSMKLAWGDGWNDAIERVNIKLQEAPKLTIEMLKRSEDFPVRALNMGQFRKGFFKYGVSDVYTSKDPIAFKLENDYMPSFVAYPLIDVNAFLALVPNVTIMLHYQDHLLKIYHDALTRNLKQYQFKEDIPSFDTFIKEWKKTDWLRLFISITTLPYHYLPEKRNEDLEKYKSEAEKMNIKIFLQDEPLYGKRFIEAMKQLLHKAMEDNVI